MVWVVALKLVVTFVEESVLLLSILEKEENENGGSDGLLPLWRIEELSVERDKCVRESEKRASAAWLGFAESMVGGECRKRDLLKKKLGRRLVSSDIWT